MLFLSLQGVFFVYAHDFDKERDASVAASTFVLDHSRPEDGIVFHIAETRIPYEFARSERAGEDTASAKFTAQLGPVISSHTMALDSISGLHRKAKLEFYGKWVPPIRGCG